MLGCCVVLAALLMPSGDAAAAETLRVAIALPLTGPQQALGRDIRAAVEFALEDHRSVGSAVAIEASWHDDGCTSEGGLAIAKRIVADVATLPIAVLGHACPSAAQAAAPIYNAAGVVFIAAGSLPTREPMSKRFGSRHFRLPADGAQGTLIGAALVDAGPDARIAFIRDRTQYAMNVMQSIAAIVTAQKRAILLVETFAGAEKDFTTLAQHIKAANITHVALAAVPSEAALLVAELRKLSPKLEILASDQLAAPEFARAFLGVAEGVKVALPPDFQTSTRAKDVARKLETAGITVNRTTLATYAAVEVLATVAEAAKSADGATLQKVLETGAFDTILGSIRFDGNGAANVPSHVFYTWTGGKLLPPVQ